jgi:hypothetical protein
MPRKLTVVFLIACLCILGFPSLGIAGGCDEPGYTGGSCRQTSSSSTSVNNGTPDDGLPGSEPSSPGSGSPGLTLPTRSSDTSTLTASSTGTSTVWTFEGIWIELYLSLLLR